MRGIVETLKSRSPEAYGYLSGNYPESVKDSFPIGRFIEVEAALTLAHDVHDAPFALNDVPDLFKGLGIVTPERIDSTVHDFMMARAKNLALGSDSVWRRRTSNEGYFSDDFIINPDDEEDMRLFSLRDGMVHLDKTSPYSEERLEFYRSCMTKSQERAASFRYAKPGRPYSFFYRENPGEDGKWIILTIPPMPESTAEPVPYPTRETRVAKIEMTYDEYVDSADEIDRILGSSHYGRLARLSVDDGLLITIDDEDADRFVLDGTAHVAGMVGSGKSVFSTTFTYFATKRKGLRVLDIRSTIAETVDATVFYRKLGIDASPLVSRNSLDQRLRELRTPNGSILLDEHMSLWLEGACVLESETELGGLYGTTDTLPCYGLREEKDGRRGTEQLRCPHIGQCPLHSMERSLQTSRVVVTTSSAYLDMKVGPGRIPLLEFAINRFDVIIADEIDRLIADADEKCAPSETLQNMAFNTSQSVMKRTRREPDQKSSSAKIDFHLAENHIEPVNLKFVSQLMRSNVANWKSVKKRTFNALRLTSALAKQSDGELDPLTDLMALYIKRLPPFEAADRDAETRILDANAAYLMSVVAGSMRYTNDETHAFMNTLLSSLGISLDKAAKNAETSVADLYQRIVFTFMFMDFERFLYRLADENRTIDPDDQNALGLSAFERDSKAHLQRRLPTAPTGNILGFQLTDRKNINILRQFALGRTIYESAPWLVTDTDGEPLGPHILMLSGSSYLPASLTFHVDTPVTHVLLTEGWKREFLSKTKVVVPAGIRPVSGISDHDVKDSNLRFNTAVALKRILEECLPYGGKVLLVTNSYDQAELVATEINALHEGLAVHIGRPNSQDSAGKAVSKYDITSFHEHAAKILVAPASIIARGYNILDSGGNAVFSNIFFMVRPLGSPDNPTVNFQRINGYTYRHYHDSRLPYAKRVTAMRKDALEFQWDLESPTIHTLANLRSECPEAYEDVVSSMFITILQIFGRCARLNDPDRPLPKLFFADAAFRSGSAGIDDMVNLISSFTERHDTARICGPLYQPLLDALRNRVDENPVDDNLEDYEDDYDDEQG